MSNNLKEHLISKAANAANEERMAADLVRGRFVRINKDFRDQPYGTSKPNLKGKTYKVTALFFQGDTSSRSNVTLWLEGLRCGISLDDVEFV